MTDNSNNAARRAFIKTVAVFPIAAAVGFAGRAVAAPVSEEDPTARSLEYTRESGVDGQSCSNCALYQGGDAPEGDCPLFPGDQVVASGWCKSWAPKS
ncbi:high-potential iron-sulfur protein [Thiohalomonas denitrificans]|uniref:High-potential iron-sulfur protein n=1 Tax=Thiohalomonas denitrificans TaxID=415747 RepID=A0A1G5PZL7_9GAMM|nr:high-potential iron-sulfur protein [Thiohalomonas denitrificans]SCZ54670.1 High potential iron-sulfur protein [Thiohalomonas denitrificans]